MLEIVSLKKDSLNFSQHRCFTAYSHMILPNTLKKYLGFKNDKSTCQPIET